MRKNGNLCENFLILMLMSMCFGDLLKHLSNGEQTKVLIAALFLNEGHFLLIDEPTNHLDAKARKSVAAYLKKKKRDSS